MRCDKIARGFSINIEILRIGGVSLIRLNDGLVDILFKEGSMRYCRRLFSCLMSFAFIQLGCVPALYAAEDSSCVKCHANEAIMKSLHKPPAMPAGESGEG